ncbi:hypothetical protein TCAL_03194 [Tigriopus californicus]|uniref:Cation-transporting ATPase n=3 Tax=Tigriopus californicus TaxID=6832 RepID=A0A553N7Y4_TIGCA|nr:hypothetical protein TCAL_03194 [Tigriopus californicus]|eukprot:TCALIF_03194-PA protein Name:"Similar to ATP13A3 Probable cation-transporting ATPase 13A3 (Homo sapiens)" AED:0.09 eAED:0.12 QI:0/-1/0/1/-1/1/1/0/1238
MSRDNDYHAFVSFQDDIPLLTNVNNNSRKPYQVLGIMPHSGSSSNLSTLYASKSVLNAGEDDEYECHGFRSKLLRTILAHMMSWLLLGLPYLIGHWKPEWRVAWFKSKCSLYIADTVLLVDLLGGASVEKVISVEVDEDFPEEFAVRPRGLAALFANLDTNPLVENDALMHRFFIHKHLKYALNTRENTFCLVRALDSGHAVSGFHTDFTGYSTHDQIQRQVLFGLNSIEIEVKSYLKLLFEEVLNPFYIFQIGSMILWSFDNYYYYATCILLISLISIGVSLVETRRQSQALHDMVSSSNDLAVTVCRGEREFEEIPSPAIVPGDLITIPAHGCVMACDAVLISGTCIVNESMLTGESVPVTKSALPHADEEEDYDIEKHKRHTLFAGTSIIQTRYYGNSHVLAVAVRTGFQTSKGELIRSILFPKSMGFKFYQDSIRFICVLFFIAAMGMCYCIYVYVHRGSTLQMIVLRCLDIITIVVPPALPAAMTVGTYYAQNRLKASKIFCISPQKINVCGKLKLICFDKTGTLTEDGLDMWGVVGVAEDEFDQPENDMTKLKNTCKMKTCLAACHSLTLIDNELTGDPLDIKMFESTDWVLEEAGEDTSKFDMIMPSVVRPRRSGLASIETDSLEDDLPFEVGIIRQFTFSSSVARMSVITRTLGARKFDVFTKGAPEKIETLCLPETIPHNFHTQLRHYTLQGFRVIALAHRTLPAEINWMKAQKIKRDVVEKDLKFLGFLIMKNTLKLETTPVIRELRSASIRCVMVTGDNLLTAISVARDCKMINHGDKVIVVEAHETEDSSLSSDGYQREHYSLSFSETENAEKRDVSLRDDFNAGTIRDTIDLERGNLTILDQSFRDYHFAMSGRTWGVVKSHFPHLLPKLILKGTIFARMAPDQKAQLVEELQGIDYIVSMCGDGANDCGALKAAHVGISLSEAEASVAAPFTSSIPNITCVPIVIREGRCALVTSFGVFKYMALYSMIQFVSVLLLYTLKTNLGDAQFLYIDLVITTVVAILMSWTGAYPKIVAKRPPGSLVSGPNLFSLLIHILLTVGFQVGAYLYLTTESWYEPNDPINPEEEVILCWETTTVFLVSSFQYLILATAFSKGPPYRKTFFTNIPFFLALVGLTSFTIGLTIYPGSVLANFLQIMFRPEHPWGRWKFRATLLVLAFLNMIAAFLVEHVVVESAWLKRASHFVLNKKEPKNKFKIIDKDMLADLEWPPNSQHNWRDYQAFSSSLS